MFDQYGLIDQIITNLSTVTVPASPHNVAKMTEVYQQLLALSNGLRNEEKRRKEAQAGENHHDGQGEDV